MLHYFNSLRLVLVSGKGGVGKTTFSCGLARWWAQTFPDQRVLLLSTDPAHSLGDVLQIEVGDEAAAVADLPNLRVRAIEPEKLLQAFREKYGSVLELLVQRGSFVQGEDLSPIWNLSWPGIDELMGILEIQQLLRGQEADRIVVDMAPSGHTLTLFSLMDFLDNLLAAMHLFQQKHRYIAQSFTGRWDEDEADRFLQEMQQELTEGRQLLQNQAVTGCAIVAIPEPMSYLETRRFTKALQSLQIPIGGIVVNRVLESHLAEDQANCLQEQQELLEKFIHLADAYPVMTLPLLTQEPLGGAGVDRLIAQIQAAELMSVSIDATAPIHLPEKLSPGLSDFVAEGRRLILVGGKGGVGKTTVSAAIGWGMAARHPDRKIRVISIDPAHSLGDAFGTTLGHEPIFLTKNLSAQEIDADRILDRFREEYLWELAAMMSGDSGENDLRIAYGPEAWRQIMGQALPGIDEMLSLLTVIEQLQGEQDLIILDTAPTGHLLRFLEMPGALGDWLAWIFKLWLKYQDIAGHTELIGKLRHLRQRVMQAQKQLQNPDHTEFIGVVQAQTAIVAEAKRLTQSLCEKRVCQRYIVHNRFESGESLAAEFREQTIVRLRPLLRGHRPSAQIAAIADLLF